jgi:RHS repeat-associated protein
MRTSAYPRYRGRLARAAAPLVRKKVVTTTFVYDNNGNVTQKTTDGTTTTYVWDYANRLTALGVLGATTTYGYDAFGNRVLQTGTSTTYIYPNKWYSIASSTGSGAKYSTTTEYVFNGDTLLATVDRQLASGTATGTAKTRYVHPDHLGSTNVVTDENGYLVQTLDYYPYGNTRVSVATSTNEKRQFIGQFADDSGLDYLNARYYSSDRGQFISEDPSFLSVGDPYQVKQVTGLDQKAFLADPQLINSYSYGRDNPITRKDSNGNAVTFDPISTFFTTVFMPSAVGDPVFNSNGTISATAQQKGINTAAFIGGFITPTGAVGAASRANVVFDGVWSVGNKATRAENALYHAFEAAKRHWTRRRVRIYNCAGLRSRCEELCYGRH